jgi:hypothetical protein
VTCLVRQRILQDEVRHMGFGMLALPAATNLCFANTFAVISGLVRNLRKVRVLTPGSSRISHPSYFARRRLTGPAGKHGKPSAC